MTPEGVKKPAQGGLLDATRAVLTYSNANRSTVPKMPESPEKLGNEAAEISPDDYCKLTAWAAQQVGHLEWLPDSNPYKAGVTIATQPCHPDGSGEGAEIPGD